jgi:hypothetical protein
MRGDNENYHHHGHMETKALALLVLLLLLHTCWPHVARQPQHNRHRPSARDWPPIVL